MYFAMYQRLGLSVSASWREIVKETSRQKIAPEARFSAEQREQRKDLYRAMLSEHQKATDLAAKVNLGALDT